MDAVGNSLSLIVVTQPADQNPGAVGSFNPSPAPYASIRWFRRQPLDLDHQPGAGEHQPIYSIQAFFDLRFRGDQTKRARGDDDQVVLSGQFNLIQKLLMEDRREPFTSTALLTGAKHMFGGVQTFNIKLSFQ